MNIRKALRKDLPAIIEMLADDQLGKERENSSENALQAYLMAFDLIQQDNNAQLLVVEGDNKVIAVAQVNDLLYLSHQGGRRALIEGVRVHKDYRGKNIGSLFMKYIIRDAEERGCHMVQLTTNKLRADAKRFYEKLGFVASHEGMKLSVF